MNPLTFARGATVAAAAVVAMLAGCSKEEKTTTTAAPAASAASAAAEAAAGPGAGGERAAQGRLRLRRPGRRRRLDLRARQRPQGAREAFRRQDRDQLRREGSRGGRCRARVPRHGEPGQQAHLRHDLRLHGADAEDRRRPARRQVRARHRLQDRAQHAHLRQPHLRGRVHGRRHRGRDDQDQHARRRRLGPDSRGDPQHQQLHARRAVGEPEDQDQGGLGQRVVQPAEGRPTPRRRSSTAAPTC